MILKLLTSKMTSITPIYFGNIDFILCYAVAGSSIQFFALSSSHVLYHVTDCFNLLQLIDRLKVICVVINIIRIMVTIKEILPSDVLPLGRVQQKGNRKTIFLDNMVEKQISSFKDLYSFTNIDTLIHIYELAKNNRGLVQAKEFPIVKKGGTYKVVLETQGFHRLPRTESDLQNIIRDILNGLVVFHKAGIVHRDIRWPNILQVANGEYVLIDLEHAGLTGEIPQFEMLTGWSSDTLENGRYTCASDMYQIGKLFDEGPTVLSEAGRKFQDNLQNPNHQIRMTAEAALQDQWLKPYE